MTIWLMLGDWRDRDSQRVYGIYHTASAAYARARRYIRHHNRSFKFSAEHKALNDREFYEWFVGCGWLQTPMIIRKRINCMGAAK